MVRRRTLELIPVQRGEKVIFFLRNDRSMSVFEKMRGNKEGSTDTWIMTLVPDH